MSYFEFFPSELVCFFRNPVRLNILFFPIIFRFYPPPNKIQSFLYCYIVYFYFPFLGFV